MHTSGLHPISALFSITHLRHGASIYLPTSAQALRNSLDLARFADRLGFTRYWVAEHHNMPAVAATSPPVLIAMLGAQTTSIRLGSGGVMLPNHVPLRVVETYRTLNGLHPGRIDLGIGRAGGSDGRTLSALRSVDGDIRHSGCWQGIPQRNVPEDFNYNNPADCEATSIALSCLERAAGIPAVLAQLLVSRGFSDGLAVRDFLDARLASLRDPEELPGASEAGRTS